MAQGRALLGYSLLFTVSGLSLGSALGQTAGNSSTLLGPIVVAASVTFFG